MFDPEVVGLLSNDFHLIVIACIGGVVLFGLKVVGYIKRAPEDKSAAWPAFFTYMALFFCLPALGAIVAGVYIVNGDKLSAILAFQVGLTSPAIVESMVIAAANQASKDPIDVSPGA